MKTLRELKEMDTIEFTELVNDMEFPKENPKRTVSVADEIVIKFAIKTPAPSTALAKMNLAQQLASPMELLKVYVLCSEIDDTLEIYTYNPNTYSFKPLAKVFIGKIKEANIDELMECIEVWNDEYLKVEIANEFIQYIVELMNIIQLTIQNKKTIYKTVKRKNVKNTSKNKILNEPKKKISVLSDERVIYTVTGETTIKQVRKYQRHTEAWSVMGFPRHYKSGKVVWVKPHIRGKGKVEAKTYQIK